MGCGSSTTVAVSEAIVRVANGETTEIQEFLNVVKMHIKENEPLRILETVHSAPDSVFTKLVNSAKDGNMDEFLMLANMLSELADGMLADTCEVVSKSMQSRDVDSGWQLSDSKELLDTLQREVDVTSRNLEKALGKTSAGVGKKMLRRMFHAIDALSASPSAVRTEVYPRFHLKGLNRCLRLIFRSAWIGTEVGGHLPKGLVANVLRVFLGNEPDVSMEASDSDDDEDDEETAAGKNDTGDFTESLAMLDGMTKSIIFHSELHHILTTQRKVKTTKIVKLAVPRQSAFLDTLTYVIKKQLLKKDLVPVLNVYFKDEFGQIESGQGHGPRKELFQLVSSQVHQRWLAEKQGQGRLNGKRGARQLTASMPGQKDLSAYVLPGYRITIKLPKQKEEKTGKELQMIVKRGGGKSARTVSSDTIMLQSVVTSKFADMAFTYAAPGMTLLSYHRASETYWLNSTVTRKVLVETGFLFLGWLIAASIVNRAQLSIQLPRVLFRQLIAEHSAKCNSSTVDVDAQEEWNDVYVPTMNDLREFDSEVADTLNKIDSETDENFVAILEAGDYSPGMSRAEYRATTVSSLLVEDVSWQVNAVRSGFRTGLGANGLAMLQQNKVTSANLVEIVCGAKVGMNSNFDLRHYFRVVMDGEVKENQILTETIFTVLNAWSPKKKRLFLVFVTGVDRLPAPGSEDLVLEMPFFELGEAGQRKTLMLLPQSHTCSNTLEIPNYQEALHGLRDAGHEPWASMSDDDLRSQLRSIVEKKFTMAVQNTAGYELDEMYVEPEKKATPPEPKPVDKKEEESLGGVFGNGGEYEDVFGGGGGEEVAQATVFHASAMDESFAAADESFNFGDTGQFGDSLTIGGKREEYASAEVTQELEEDINGMLAEDEAAIDAMLAEFEDL